ncbi:hypothetical protein [Nonomuraea typhae]|uniref:hypothetical protein n=1 Tax=Nonomuraea typhae TaxID=2603600 RepID=UPI0012FBBCF4|nr:hypothetical protein [Nonomuraea typhae]
MNRVAVMLLVAMAAAGCARPDAGAARAAAEFSAALAGARWGQACALLTERAREGLETGGKACEETIRELRLPGGPPHETLTYGDEARVRLAGDTVFLHRFGDRWRVHGAGCRPRPGLPYQCEIGG